jgi:F0F1-type ATP synthase epsilon subunit
LKVSVGDQHQTWFINAGFAQVLGNKVTVLTQEAIKAELLDPLKAQAMLDQASRMQVRDEVSARKRSEMEASARAQLRLAPKKQQEE